MPPSRRHTDKKDQLDTGERNAIAEQVANKLAEHLTMDDVNEAIKEHAEKCPTKLLASEVETLKKRTGEISTTVTSIQASLDTAVRLLYLGVVAAFAVSVALTGAAWAIYTRLDDKIETSKHSSEILDDEHGKVAASEPYVPAPLVYPPITPAIVPAAKLRRTTSTTQASATASPAGARFVNPLHYLQGVQ